MSDTKAEPVKPAPAPAPKRCLFPPKYGGPLPEPKTLTAAKPRMRKQSKEI